VSTVPTRINALEDLTEAAREPAVVTMAPRASTAVALAAIGRPLTELPLRVDARIVALVPPEEAHDPEIVARLGELGFLPGERVRILARAPFGDPRAVRVGTGTFALRAGEAHCVHVRLEDESRRP
jgi:ferrous iron transport protein A